MPRNDRQSKVDPSILTPPRAETTVTLPDGRRLGLADFGDSDGRPILWFHGTPGGRHQLPETVRGSLAANDARVIVVERPGYGESTPHLYEQVRDVSRDIEHLTDAIGIDRFAVAGLSGGGPYALAIAHDHGDRVVAAAVLGGVVPHLGPESHPGGWVSTLAPLSGLARRSSKPLGSALGFLIRVMDPVADPVFRATARMFPEGDREVFARPEMQAMFLHDIDLTAQGGLPGPLYDLVLFTREWGFQLADITVPAHFWQGDADPIVTLDQAEKMAGIVADSTFNLRPGESHLGGFAAGTDAVEAVLAHWPN